MQSGGEGEDGGGETVREEVAALGGQLADAQAGGVRGQPLETVVDALRREGYNVRIIVRTTERGLSSAVVRGFRESQGDNMLCMDADLQVRLPYPPSTMRVNPQINSTC